MSETERPKRLASATVATAYQKQWFADLRERALGGEFFALVNADAPHEILRAIGVPYVVNQWWASIVSAKRESVASLAVLTERGYPDYSRQYDAIALGSVDLPPESSPWGGLPRPGLVIAESSGDASRKIFDLWARHPDTEFFPYERTAADPAPSNWWELVPRRWEEAFGSDRVDLMAEENLLLIERLEALTGRRFELDRLREIMGLSNEQAELNRDSRDLLARTHPMPVRVTDTIPSVMIPQWHRGTQWAVDAARRLNDDIRAQIAEGNAVVPDERMRLMWIGRGLWGDLDLYREFEQKYGAVFVWSMYLAIAADGYARYGDDPIRALAARFLGFTDQLYTPPWSTEWYVKEALTHGVDGVVHLVADDVPASHFTTEAFEAAGIPVLELTASNADERALAALDLRGRISHFIETRVGQPARAGGQS